jgi:hypothetical protein
MVYRSSKFIVHSLDLMSVHDVIASIYLISSFSVSFYEMM